MTEHTAIDESTLDPILESLLDVGPFPNPGLEMALWHGSTAPTRRIAYDPDSLRSAVGGMQFGDLRLPSIEPGPNGYPVVILIHGGLWQSDWGIDHLAPFAEAVTNAGVATWNIEFRRYGNNGAGWPGTFIDVFRAIDHLRVLAPEYHLDLDRVVVSGHSAGGHLALIAHARTRIPADSEIFIDDPLPLSGVVALDPCGLDLIADAASETGRLQAVVLDLLGVETPEEAQRRAGLGASPTQLLPHGGRQRIFTGTTGAYAESVRQYTRLAASAGDDIHTGIFVGADHFDQVDPCGPGFPAILTALFELIDEVPTAAAQHPGEDLGHAWQILPRSSIA